MPNSRLRRATSKQVAEKAGVSQTTVSFVMNNVESANISEETRQRVMQAARELNYIPDVAARALARGRSDNIALVLARPHRQVFIDEYIPSILTGLNEITQEHGFRILVELIDSDVDANAYLDLIKGKEVAGMIVNLHEHTLGDIEKLRTATKEGFPIVILDILHPELYSVTVDKISGVQRLIRHLIDLGHERIACINYAPPGQYHAEKRLAMYQATLEAAGLRYDERLVRFGAYDPETGYEAMKSLLENGPRFTALYAMNDVMAFGAITAAREYGLRVPEDMAVVGFDDIRLARFCTPPLTTVREPDIKHGRRTGEMLVDLINGVKPSQAHVVLETELIVRQSCGAYLRSQP